MVNIREHQGEIVLYHWVEALRTFIDEKFADSQNKVDEQSNVDQIIETGERFFFLVLFFSFNFMHQVCSGK